MNDATLLKLAEDTITAIQTISDSLEIIAGRLEKLEKAIKKIDSGVI